MHELSHAACNAASPTQNDQSHALGVCCVQAGAQVPTLERMRAVSTRVSRCVRPAAGIALTAVWVIGLGTSTVTVQRANRAFVGQQSPLRWFEEFSRAGSAIYGGDFVVLAPVLHDMSAVKMNGTWVRSLVKCIPCVHCKLKFFVQTCFLSDPDLS